MRAETGVEHVFQIARILPLFSFYDNVADAMADFETEPLPEAEESAAAES